MDSKSMLNNIPLLHAAVKTLFIPVEKDIIDNSTIDCKLSPNMTIEVEDNNGMEYVIDVSDKESV